MANYSLVLDTKFKPFSYAEMLAPVAAATQAHQALEEEYGNLSAKADVWENMANEQSDPLAYKMYKGYSDDLRDRADTLLREGLNASSRKGMLDMRARYSKEIAPIEIAYKRREELAAEQRKAYAANPTLRYERYANAMSLDDFIKNPSIDYGRSYSGALLTQQVAQAAANYAKVLTREGKLKSLGLPYLYTRDLGYGATPEQVLAVINKAAQDGEEGAISFLRGIRDLVIASSGTNAWITPGSAAAQERDAFANMGLYSALGQTQIKDYTDTYSMNNALEIAKEKREKKQAEVNALYDMLKQYDTNPQALFGQSDTAKKNRDEAKELKSYIDKGYLRIFGNGRLAMTKSGMAHASTVSTRRAAPNAPHYAQGVIPKYTDDENFVSFLRRHGATDADFKSIREGNISININNKMTSLRNRINSGQFATGTPNIDGYRIKVDDSDSKNLMGNLETAVNSTGYIKRVVGLKDSKGKHFQYKDRSIPYMEFETENIGAEDFIKELKETDTNYLIPVPMANKIVIQLKNGSLYEMPSTMISRTLYDDLTNESTGLNAQLAYLAATNASKAQKATTMNQIWSTVANGLTTVKGAKITPSDGTVSFPIWENEEE